MVFCPTPLKNDGVKVSWDDEIPNIWKKNPSVPNHQPNNIVNQSESLINFARFLQVTSPWIKRAGTCSGPPQPLPVSDATMDGCHGLS